MIERLDDQLFLVDGPCLVRDLNCLYRFAIPESEVYATLGGLSGGTARTPALCQGRGGAGGLLHLVGWLHLITRGTGRVPAARFEGRHPHHDISGFDTRFTGCAPA